MNIDEKLALLQGLFLQRAAVDGQITALIENGGKEVSMPEEKEEEPVVKKKAQKSAGNKVASRGFRFDPAIKAEIVAEYKAGGNTINGLARKHKIGYGTVWAICRGAKPGVIRAKGNSGEPLKLSTTPEWYSCLNSHRFQSKLPLTHARCPTCRELAVEKVVSPVFEEETA